MLVRDAALKAQCISEMIIWYLFNLQKQLSRWTIMFSYETLNADDYDLNLNNYVILQFDNQDVLKTVKKNGEIV